MYDMKDFNILLTVPMRKMELKKLMVKHQISSSIWKANSSINKRIESKQLCYFGDSERNRFVSLQNMEV